MGKRAGKDVEGRPAEKSSWDFHDCERQHLMCKCLQHAAAAAWHAAAPTGAPPA